jgi:hypothetical protein
MAKLAEGFTRSAGAREILAYVPRRLRSVKRAKVTSAVANKRVAHDATASDPCA